MNYYLIIEKRHGDFQNIDPSLLVGHIDCDYRRIENIDAFTSLYSEEEFKNKLKDANIVSEDYLTGKLLIIDTYKRTYKILKKEITNLFDIEEFICHNIKDKNMMNQIKSKYALLSKNNDALDFQKAIDTESPYLVLSMIYQLPYLDLRQMFIYISENIIIKNEDLKRGLLKDK